MTLDLLSQKKSSLFIFIAASIAVLMINIFFFHYLQKAIINDNYENFVVDSKYVINKIRERLNHYEIVLRGARGLFAASKSVERDEWKKYVNDLAIADKFPGIQAVGFSLYIPKQALAAHLEQMRLEGFSNYNIWPQGEREEYTSIIYIEPFEGKNLRAFGYDMMSEAVRAKAMKMARDTNETTFSGKVRLVQETDVNIQNGFVMYLPVYKNNFPHETMEERRTNLLGFVYIPYRMDDFIWGVIRNELNDFRIEIYNGKNMLAENMLFDNKKDADKQELSQYTFEYKEEVPLFQNTWTFRISAVPQSNIGVSTFHFLVFFIGGVIISFLLIGLLWLFINNKKEASRLAEVITTDLKRSEASFRAMNEASPLGIFMTDPLGKCLYTNSVYQNISGLTAEEAVGDGWVNSIHPEDRYQVTQQWKAFVERKVPKYQSIHRFLKKNGTVAWTKVQSVQVNSGNQLSGYLGVVEDITDIKLQEGALKESEERARLIIDSALDAIVIIDENSRIVGWNKHAEQIFGYKKESAIGSKLEEKIAFINNHIVLKEGFKNFLTKRQDFEFNRRFHIDVIHQDGHQMVIEMSVSSISIDGREHFSLFIRDITDHLKNEEMVKQRNYMLERMNKLMIDREMKMIELKKEIKQFQNNQKNSSYSI